MYFNFRGMNSHRFETLFSCSLLCPYGKRWEKKKGSDNFMEVAFFWKKEKEKCSRDLQEIVFHYRRLGDEREEFYPLGQAMPSPPPCHLSAYARAHKRVHCGHVNMFKWQMISDGKKEEGCVWGWGVCARVASWWSDVSATFPRAKVRTSLLLAVSRLTLCCLKTIAQHFATNVWKGTKWKTISHDSLRSVNIFFRHCHQMFSERSIFFKPACELFRTQTSFEDATRQNKIKARATLKSRCTFQTINPLLQLLPYLIV